MPGSGTSTYDDPDDYQANLPQARIELHFIAPGAFKARLTWVQLYNLHLLRCQENLPRIGYLSLTSELIFVAFPMAPDPLPLWSGAEVQSGEIMFHSRGERLHQRTRGPCLWSLIALPPADLEEYGRAFTREAVLAPSAHRILRPRPSDAARLLRLHAQACRLAETRPNILVHSEVARALEQDLVHALITCLAAGVARDSGTAKRHHEQIMVRFEEVLAEEHPGSRDLPEVCELIGVTDRTLRSCCAEFLGISPSRYLLLRRLERVRRALRNANPVTTGVAELAQRHGFTELGRFAGDYRRAFGELPSATLGYAHRSRFLRPISSDSA